MDNKRKRDISEKRVVKRFQPELFDSEDEEEMCRIADEVEMWGEDDNLEELMAQAVDNWEQQNAQEVEKIEPTTKINQQGQGKTLNRDVQRNLSDIPPQTTSKTQGIGQQQQGTDGQQQRSDEQQQGTDGQQHRVDEQQQHIDGQQQGLAGPQPRESDQQNINSNRSTSSNAALNGAVVVQPFIPNNRLDILGAFHELERDIVRSLEQLLRQHGNTRVYITLNVTYTRLHEGQILQHQQVFRSNSVVLASENDIADHLSELMRQIFERSQEFQAQGSGWTLERINCIEVHAAKYVPLQGSSYIRLPKAIETTRSVLNIKNQDEKCVVWSILAFLHPVDRQDHPQMVNKYRQYENELNLQDVKFPTPLKDIKKIEQQNNLSINVFGYDRVDKISPLYITRNIKERRHVNLLLISEGEKRHYCLIRNFSRLLSYRTKHRATQFFCFNCLHSFRRQELLDKHKPCV